MLCLTCLLSAIILSFLDWYGFKKLQIEEVRSVSSTGVCQMSWIMLLTHYILNGLVQKLKRDSIKGSQIIISKRKYIRSFFL